MLGAQVNKQEKILFCVFLSTIKEHSSLFVKFHYEEDKSIQYVGILCAQTSAGSSKGNNTESGPTTLL